MFENFRITIHSLGKFSEKDVDFLVDHLKVESYPKGYCLLNEGKICQSIYFINQGSLRQYYIAETGDEIIQNLFIENDWVLEYKSFTSQKHSTSIIEVTEDSEVLNLSVYDLHKLMKISDAYFQIARIFQYAIDRQEYKTQKLSPKDRYIDLLTNKPKIIQRFPLKYIASYLDMTPETLSRVRRRASKLII